MNNAALIDVLVIASGVVFYAFLCFVYLLRAFGKDKLELLMAPVFSLLLFPFTALFIANLLVRDDIYRLITLVPMLLYLLYDLWYRLLSKKKPVHHPKKWPLGLVVYLILLQIAAVSLNWYGFLVSQSYGRGLIACYFVMLGFFGVYQRRYNKRMRAQDLH
ncbi:MAG: hypothetical protein MIO90_03650 [Methanomassiliicoccales archaeon]|nr:hypothetical protein [Methanomassiliicoccales archaeon]